MRRTYAGLQGAYGWIIVVAGRVEMANRARVSNSGTLTPQYRQHIITPPCVLMFGCLPCTVNGRALRL